MDSYSQLHVEEQIIFGAMMIHHTAKVIGHQSEMIVSDDDHHRSRGRRSLCVV